MATLYERITGVGLSEDGSKLGIHQFIAAIYEQQMGYFTAQNVVDAFSLTPAQESAAVTFVQLLNAAPDKMRFVRVFKNIAYLAEAGYAYQTASAMLTRLQDEVTDQGGTVP